MDEFKKFHTEKIENSRNVKEFLIQTKTNYSSIQKDLSKLHEKSHYEVLIPINEYAFHAGIIKNTNKVKKNSSF